MAIRQRSRRPSVARPGSVPRIIVGIVAWIFGGAALSAPLVLLGPVGAVLGAVLWMAPILLVGPLYAGGLVTATAGSDGVHVRSFGRDHFVAYREIAALSIDGARLALRRHDGSFFHLELMGTPGRHGAMPLHDVEGSPFVAAIHEGMARSRVTRDVAPIETGLARGGRASDAWLVDVRTKVESRGFRDGTLDEEALVRVAADGAADPSARAASALALRAIGAGTEARALLRVAAVETAHPKVRVALETAAESEDVGAVQRAVARVT